MERLKQIKEALVNCVQAQVGQGLKEVDTKELGEAIDMLKDMEEAIYYCSIVKAMEEGKEEEKYKQKFFAMYPQYNRMFADGGRMFADGGSGGSSGGGGNSSGGNSGGSGSSRSGGGGRRGYEDDMMDFYEDERKMYFPRGGGRGSGGRRGYNEMESYPYPAEIRDYREGRSPITRRNYMESKELHQDKAKQIQELEKYVKELSDDVLEMIKEASPEEKQILSQKISALATKIQ